MKKILIPLLLILITSYGYATGLSEQDYYEQRSENETTPTTNTPTSERNIDNTIDDQQNNRSTTTTQTTPPNQLPSSGGDTQTKQSVGEKLKSDAKNLSSAEKTENEMAEYINSWTCSLGGLPLTLNDNREFSLPNASNSFIELQLEYAELEAKLAEMQ